MPTPFLLETERLGLRPMLDADVEPLMGVLSDPVAMRFYPAPYDRAGVEGWVRRSQARYREWGFGLWALVLKESGQVIGDCGLTWQRVGERDELEIGYHVLPALQGRGLATEAARACLAWGFAHTDAERIISLMVVDNAPSRAVAAKVHARFLGPCGERAGLPHVHYGTARAEFEAKSAAQARAD